MFKLQGFLLITFIFFTLSLNRVRNGDLGGEYLELTQMVDERGGYPHITSDIYGTLYVTWLIVGDDSSTNSAYFTLFKDGEWQRPLELLYSPQNILLGDIHVTLDGRISVVWSSGNRIYITYCESADILNIRNWKTETITITEIGMTYPSFPHLAVSGDENLWVLSWATPLGVYVKISNDGRTWLPERLIWPVPSSQTAPSNGSILLTDADILVSWSEHDERKNWAGQAIWYARIDQQTLDLTRVSEAFRTSWEEGPTVSWPLLARGAEDDVYLFWNNGVGSRSGRFYQVSNDGGGTWGPVKNIFPGGDGLSGQTGLAQIIVDSAQQVHVITAAYSTGGTYLRYFSGGDDSWSDYQTIVTDRLSDDDEVPSVTLTGGNTIHIVWHDILGRIFYKEISTGSPAISLPTRPPRVEVTPTHGVVTPETSLGTAWPTIVPLEFSALESDQGYEGASTFLPLVVSGVVVLFLMGLIAVFHFRRKG